eukprot:gene17045-20265_t
MVLPATTRHFALIQMNELEAHPADPGASLISSATLTWALPVPGLGPPLGWPLWVQCLKHLCVRGASTIFSAEAQDRGSCLLRLAPTPEMLSLLLKLGADVEEVSEGQSALQHAVHAKDPARVSILLAYGADPYFRNLDGRTALQLGCERVEVVDCFQKPLKDAILSEEMRREALTALQMGFTAALRKNKGSQSTARHRLEMFEKLLAYLCAHAQLEQASVAEMALALELLKLLSPEGSSPSKSPSKSRPRSPKSPLSTPVTPVTPEPILRIMMQLIVHQPMTQKGAHRPTSMLMLPDLRHHQRVMLALVALTAAENSYWECVLHIIE